MKKYEILLAQSDEDPYHPALTHFSTDCPILPLFLRAPQVFIRVLTNWKYIRQIYFAALASLLLYL